MTLTQSRRTGARSLMVFAACLFPLTLAARAQNATGRRRRSQRRASLRCIPQCPHRDPHLLPDQRDPAERTPWISLPPFATWSARAPGSITTPRKGPSSSKLPQLSWTAPKNHPRTRPCPTKAYRITYTLTELDAGKTISTRHYSMLIGDGEHSSMKEGNKIPIATGTYANGAAATSPASEVQTQFTYLDIGMNFDASIAVSDTTVHLRSKVEDSSLGSARHHRRRHGTRRTPVRPRWHRHPDPRQTSDARHHRHPQQHPPHRHRRSRGTSKVANPSPNASRLRSLTAQPLGSLSTWRSLANLASSASKPLPFFLIPSGRICLLLYPLPLV